MTEEKRSITAEDLYKFELISGLDISPDGKQVIYAQQRVDQKTEKKFSNLWIVPFDATQGKLKEKDQSRQFTYGDQNDHTPKWSSDGTQIAFISNRKNEVPIANLLDSLWRRRGPTVNRFERTIWLICMVAEWGKNRLPVSQDRC